MKAALRVALISETFFDRNAGARLAKILQAARSRGASVAALPELPCNHWAPASQQADAADAEPPNGPRHELQAAAARAAGIGLLGGAIVIDPQTGIRHNTALLFAGSGDLLHSYEKIHIPQEPGFYEQDHYAAGREPPQRIDAFHWPLGIQICSDINRPQGSHLLGASGAAAILAPRATEAATFDRWEMVIRTNAMTSCCYYLSVNRPRPEHGVALGGPTLAVAPDGEILACTEETMCIVDLDDARLEEARQRYPGYLDIRSEIYAAGWQKLVQTRPPKTA